MAKVSDFGLSTAHSLFVKGRVVDNPMWLAVEVIRGEAFSLKSDVYSYGIILWELITCQPPFREHLEASMFWFDLEQKIMNGMSTLSCTIIVIDQYLCYYLKNNPNVLI